MRRPSPESASQALALVFTVALVAVTFVAQKDVTQQTVMDQPAVQIELAPDPTPQAPPPAEVQPPPPKPLPRKKERVPKEVVPVAEPLMAADDPTPMPEAAAAPSEAADPAPPAPPPKVAGSIEAQYAATLRSNIDARTVVPDSIEYRLQHPRGETRVYFILDRDGSLLSATVAGTSGSDILDRQAVRIVKAGRYPPFPPDGFRGEPRHSFTVTLEFNT